MLYEIDAFGFVGGYISMNWSVMSEEDILTDNRLARKLYETKYQNWKRYNIVELIDEYKQENQTKVNFERFCRELFRRI